MYKVVPAGPDEIPLIRELCFRVWPQTYAEVLSREQIDYMLEQMYSPESLSRQMTSEHCQFLLVYSGDEPKGFASYSETEPGVFKLHKLYVVPEEQGKGAGRFLVDHILEVIRAQGARSLQLQVNRGNRARFFYERLGFRVAKEIDLDIGNGFFMNDYVMEKEL